MPRLADSILRDSELTWIRQSKLAPRKRRQPKSARILRAWIAQLRANGEVQDITGAEREQEIGGIVDIYQRKIGNPAVLFDDIPGYPKGHRILANILTSIRRINMTLGLIRPTAPRSSWCSYWRRYMKEAQDHPAGRGDDRRAAGERPDRRRHRPVQDPGAALARARRRLLHRHRRHGDHARSRHRLDQLRRLSRAGARQATSPP